MGVTLERVQNKFACIIGELCSEPVILSQFAIWLDLRLAEYKSKGAISLECSGCEPDPTWLRGHRHRGRMKRAMECRAMSANTPESYRPAGDGRFPLYNDYEEDVSVLSEEEQEDVAVMGAGFSDTPTNSGVFPIHMYKVTTRKRPVVDPVYPDVDPTVPRERSFDLTPSQKSQRLEVQGADCESSASLSDVPGATDSLASIIKPESCAFNQPEHSTSAPCSEQLPTPDEREPLQIIVKTEKPSTDGSVEMTETHVQLTDEDLSAYTSPANFSSCGESSNSSGLPNRLTSHPDLPTPKLENEQQSFPQKDTSMPAENTALVDVADTAELLDLQTVIGQQNFSHDNDDAADLQTATVVDGFVGCITNRTHQNAHVSLTEVPDLDERCSRDSVDRGAQEDDSVVRRKKRSWAQADMDHAVMAVQSGVMSQRRACQLLGVPRTSLQRRLMWSLLREEK